MKAKKWVLVKHFDGSPKLSDLKLEEEELTAIKENEILVEALFLSLDPYMRAFSGTLSFGSTMIGEQVAKLLGAVHILYNAERTILRVVESKNSSYPVGSLVLTSCGWRDKTVINPNKTKVRKAWNTGKHSPSLTLGVLGMPGQTALIGLTSICKPESGETLFVNSSAGIVGALVGQIGKIKGCRVIGCAGTDEKCNEVKSKYGFDSVFNYKTCDLFQALLLAAPNGIDCYFDNVGGAMSEEVIFNHMNYSGRIACCGSLSTYNAKEPPTGKLIFFEIAKKQLRMEGLKISEYKDDLRAASAQLLKWLDKGKIKMNEIVIDGIENMSKAFIDFMNGTYSGKVVIKA